MTQQEFADFIGTTPATLSGIFNERTRPTLSIVEMIKKKIPDINTDWLILGNGDMFRQSSEVQNDKVLNANTGRFSGGQPKESMLDFGPESSPTPPHIGQTPSFSNGVVNTPANMLRENLKIVDKPKRHVTEIRVYYDDQTWESFLPSKK